MFTTSEKTDLLEMALVRVQAKLQPVEMDATNPHFKKPYTSLTALMQAVRPALVEQKIAFTQWLLNSDDNKLHLLTRLAHKGQWMQAHASIPMGKFDPQGAGGAASYLKRYALAAALGVVSDLDDDAEGSMGRGSYKPPAASKETSSKAAVKTAAAQKVGSPPQTTTKGPSAPPKEPMATAPKRVPASNATLKKLDETMMGQNWTKDEVCEVISQKSQGKLTQPKDLSESQCIALIQTINDMSFGQWHQTNL